MERSVVDGKGVPANQQLPYPLATVLSLSAILSFLSSRAKPRDLQFHFQQPLRLRKRTADPCRTINLVQPEWRTADPSASLGMTKREDG
jgi:hypothetical protein